MLALEPPYDNVIQLRPGLPKPRDEGPLFSELAADWMRSEGLGLVEPENVRRHIDHLRPLWRLTEKELSPGVVKEALKALLKPNGPLGAATVNKVQGTGRQIIREAQLYRRWIGPNPFEIVERQTQKKKVFRDLSLEECRILLPHLREDRRREALFMLYLGLRPGELKALQWADVDLRASTVLIRRSNGRDSTKTGTERLLPILEPLRPVLDAALKANPKGCPLVFPTPEGEMQRADAKLTRMLQEALRKAGLVTAYTYTCRRRGCGHREERQVEELARCPACNMKLWVQGNPLPVRFYDLRASAATLHRRAGADPLAIQLVLGHATTTTTDRYYIRFTVEDLRREFSKLRI